MATIPTQFAELIGYQPMLSVRAPGRINIIGEHTDYNEGLVMPGAIDRHLIFSARPNGSQRLRLWARDIDQFAEVDLSQLVPGDQQWVNYLAGIAQQFQQRGFSTPGLDVVFGGNLPVGAGVSSSAALECGMATVWNEILDAGLSGPELAQLAQASSHQFVGVPCGIMDQFASLNGQHEAVILLDCRSLEYETTPAAIPGYEWVLLNSKVSHDLASSEYPVRVAECRQGVEIMQQFYPEVNSLRDLSLAQLEKHQGQFPTKVYQRCHYVVAENDRVMAMKEALAQGDAKKVGTLLNATHAGLRDEYEVSCAEIEILIQTAVDHAGVVGARIMGGGFGGCTLNLVKTEERDSFVEQALRKYEKETGKPGEFLAVHLRAGVEVIPTSSLPK